MSAEVILKGWWLPFGCPNAIGCLLFNSVPATNWRGHSNGNSIRPHMGVPYVPYLHEQIHVAKKTAICALMVLGGIVSGVLWAVAVNALATTLSVGFRVTFLNAVIPSAQWLLPMRIAAVAGGVISGLHGILCTPGTYRFFYNIYR